MRTKIAFIGVGNMASAIIKGMLSPADNKDGFAPSDLILFDTDPDKTVEFCNLGARCASSVEDAAAAADCIMLCVKPQNFPEVLPKLSKAPSASDKLYVTIAAGIPMSAVSQAVGGAPVVRALPNTPIFIAQGVSAICRNELVSNEDFSFACKIFSGASRLLTIDESEMNRIISVTSSSPAYVFLFIRAILDGAKAQGLIREGGIDEQTMLSCICDMVAGSTELLKQSGKTPEQQINTVASKGGTTERALATLDENGFADIIKSAMESCTARADELGRGK